MKSISDSLSKYTIIVNVMKIMLSRLTYQFDNIIDKETYLRRNFHHSVSIR